MPPHPTSQPVKWLNFVHPQYWLTWTGLACLRLLTALPLAVSSPLCTVIGDALYFLFGQRRKIVITNLGRCFPDWDPCKLKRIARQNFHATARGMRDMGIAWWASRKRLQDLVSVSGQQYFDDAKKEGRPVILLVGHFVAIDIAGMYISSTENITSIFKRPKNKLIHAMMIRGRLRFGTMTLVESKEGMKPIMRAFKRKDPFYFPSDQDFGRLKSVFVPFFNIQAATVPTLGRLAKLSDAIVIPCFTRQLAYGKGYEVTFKPPLDDFPVGDEITDTSRMNEVIETAVREMPEQYFWAHRRFKTRPDNGEQNFYK